MTGKMKWKRNKYLTNTLNIAHLEDTNLCIAKTYTTYVINRDKNTNEINYGRDTTYKNISIANIRTTILKSIDLKF